MPNLLSNGRKNFLIVGIICLAFWASGLFLISQSGNESRFGYTAGCPCSFVRPWNDRKSARPPISFGDLSSITVDTEDVSKKYTYNELGRITKIKFADDQKPKHHKSDDNRHKNSTPPPEAKAKTGGGS